MNRRRAALTRCGLVAALAVVGLLAVGPANGDGAQPPPGSRAVPAHPDPVGTQPARGSHVSTVHPGKVDTRQPAAR